MNQLFYFVDITLNNFSSYFSLSKPTESLQAYILVDSHKIMEHAHDEKKMAWLKLRDFAGYDIISHTWQIKFSTEIHFVSSLTRARIKRSIRMNVIASASYENQDRFKFLLYDHFARRKTFRMVESQT